MLDSTTKRRIDDCRDILVGKVPDPKSQIDQITVALIYKFMHDMDQEAVELGGTATFFAKHTVKVNGKDEVKDYAPYAWPNLMAKELGGEDRVKLYAEALEQMPENPGLPPLFRDIFKNTFLPYRDPATLREFLKRIDEFTYDHSEKLGDAFEYLLSIMGSQGDAGQFRTPRHLIDFMTAVIDPRKHETILDPACGTAGFLISAYKHILRHNSSNHAAEDPLAFQLHGVKQEDLTVSAKKYSGDKLTPDDRKRLVKNLVGYDIDPGMVKLSLVNLYLHGFPEPHIHEYDTLTSTDRWEERFDVVLANPPFMSPKGGIQPHSKFGIPSTRSEVLFVDYIAEHLNPNGRALVVVPEGIIFQSGKAYKALRKKLVDEHYLVGVVSLPGGVFNPYSGVKTSLLWFDRALARKTDKLLFVKIEHDGFDLGAQRRPIVQNDLPEAFGLLSDYKEALSKGADWMAPSGWEKKALLVERSDIGSKDEYILSGERYAKEEGRYGGDHTLVNLGELCEIQSGFPFKSELFNTSEGFPLIRIRDIKPSRTETKYTGEFDQEYVVNDGDLLIGMDGEFNATLWAGGPALLNQRVCRLLPNDRVLKEYVFQVIQKKLKEIEDATYAVTVKHLSVKQIKAIQIPLPPLSEQEALVAEVEGYQRVIDGARQVVAHYKPRITIDPKWEMVELGDVCESITDGDHMPPPKSESGIPFVTISNIEKDNRIDFTKTYFVPEEYYGNLKSHRRPQRGDVLYTVTGSYGVPVLIDFDRRFCFQRHIGLVRPSSSILPQFLFYLFCSPFMVDQADKAATGVAQKTVSLTSLRKFRIPLPPLPEQERIVAALEEERRMVEAARALAERMEDRVRERVARVWGSGSDDQMIGRSENGMPLRETGVEGLDEGSDEMPELELAVAAEPVSSYGAAQAVVRRGPGRPPKGDGTTGNAEAMIQNYLQAHPGWHGKAAILEATGVDAGAWNAAIKELLEGGKVERQGEKKGARYRAQ